MTAKRGNAEAFSVGLAVTLLAVAAAGAGSAIAWRAATAKWASADPIPREGRPGGYVSSAECRACHSREYESWHRSYHRTMTQLATAEAVRGDFGDVLLQMNGESYKLYRKGGEFWSSIPDPLWKFARQTNRLPKELSESGPPQVERRIAMITGSHQMQVYWVSGGAGNGMFSLPWTYLFQDKRWVPRKDSLLGPPSEPYGQELWNMNCMFCHATAGQPQAGPPPQVLDTRVAEIGIGCEACHGPGEEHVRANRNPLRRYRLHLDQSSADPTIVNPARLSPQASSQICGQCHGVTEWLDITEVVKNGLPYRPGADLFKTQPLIRPLQAQSQPWVEKHVAENPMYLPQRFWSDGTIRVSGRDYNGMIESSCYKAGRLSCISCHSMHDSPPVNQLAAGMDSDMGCLQCHSRFKDNIPDHTHHLAESPGSRCYNCHMPYTVYGLLRAIRNHRIDSPSVRTSASGNRPNACNLCHLNHSLGWTMQYMSRWYGEPAVALEAAQESISAAALGMVKGDAVLRAITTWQMGWGPARRASNQDWIPQYLALQLTDPYSAVRYVAFDAIRRSGEYRKLDFDYLGSSTEQLGWIRTYLKDLKEKQPLGVSLRPELLIGENGVLVREKIDGLLKERDDRPIDAME